jgi:hypothetical protein
MLISSLVGTVQRLGSLSGHCNSGQHCPPSTTLESAETHLSQGKIFENGFLMELPQGAVHATAHETFNSAAVCRIPGNLEQSALLIALLLSSSDATLLHPKSNF